MVVFRAILHKNETFSQVVPRKNLSFVLIGNCLQKIRTVGCVWPNTRILGAMMLDYIYSFQLFLTGIKDAPLILRPVDKVCIVSFLTLFMPHTHVGWIDFSTDPFSFNNKCNSKCRNTSTYCTLIYFLTTIILTYFSLE